MSRIYTVPLFPQAVTTAQDLFEVQSGSAKVTRIVRWEVSQYSEVGDTQEEGLTLIVRKEVDTTGSGGTTVTPTRADQGDPNFSGTCKVGNTTKAGGSPDVSKRFAVHNWNVRVPFEKVYLPEDRPVLSPSERLVIEIYQNPADSITIGGVIVIEEIG